MFGYDAEEIIGQTISHVTHPDDYDMDADLMAQMVRGEIADYQLDKRYVRKDGAVIVGRLTASLVRTPDGEPLYAIGLVEDVTERVAAVRTIGEQQERLAMTLEAAGMAAWEIDIETGAYTVADNLGPVFGVDENVAPEETLEEFMERVHPDDLELFLGPGVALLDEVPDVFAVEFRIRKQGGEAWIRTQGEFVRDDQGVPRSIRGVSMDVTVQRREDELRAEAAEVFRRTIEASSDAFVGADACGLITDWNPAAEHLLGWTAEEVLGTSLVERVFPEEDREIYATHLRAMAPGASAQPAMPARVEMTAVHRTGHQFPVEVSLVTVAKSGETQVRAFVRDITERRAHELELTERALTDHLTGLPNRTLLSDRLRTAVSAIGRRGRGAAVLFIDVDRFKAVNDSLGHRTGDNLLIGLAGRLQSAVRPDDTVARIGGDEFVVLCQDVEHLVEAVEVAERIFAVLEEPFTLGTRSHQVDVSIGIAHAATPEVSADDLLRDADVAMYQAKAAGGARIEVFSPALRDRARRRLDLEDELRQALATDELVAYFQPVVDLDPGLGQFAGRVVGFEALARWHHPTRGIIEPGLFIASAEETGLIVPLGETVLDQACQRLAEWRALPGGEDLTMAVNLSGRQLVEPGLIHTVEDILRAHDVPASALCLEITESMLMADSLAATTTLEALDELGVAVAVDDFGTGYSSLLYLRRFPVRILKLDRFFVSGVASNDTDRAIVGSMIDLAHSLGMRAVAEGVETAAQLEALRALGCDQAQGYLWSAPVAAHTAEGLLGTL
jgi:diguanylate cyclase (GGDEF)-like protein/PAS domain S-box-containing protein